MTPYRVEWETEADDRLAEIWTNAKDRAAITRAAHEIDRMLTRDPENVGMAISEGLRRVAVGPLTIFFSIDMDKYLVEVARVRTT